MLYKYCGPTGNTTSKKKSWGIEALREKRLKMMNPLACNDPFEFLPAVYSKQVNEDDVKRYLFSETSITRIREIKYRISGIYYNDEVIKAEIRADYKKLKKRLLEQNNTFPFFFKESVKDYFFVTCFSKYKSNLLLWSHYADMHRGLVIGFDEEQIAQPFEIHDVIYADQRPEYHPAITSLEKDYVLKILRTKSKKWEYEAETRVFSNKADWLTFSSQAVKEVIVGCCWPNEDTDELLNVLTTEYPHVRPSKMAMSKTLFALEEHDFISPPSLIISAPSPSRPS